MKSKFEEKESRLTLSARQEDQSPFNSLEKTKEKDNFIHHFGNHLDQLIN
jgi:hypothetical protein